MKPQNTLMIMMAAAGLGICAALVVAWMVLKVIT